jgi:hypothetical protein
MATTLSPILSYFYTGCKTDSSPLGLLLHRTPTVRDSPLTSHLAEHNTRNSMGLTTLWTNSTGAGTLAKGVNMTLTRATGTFWCPEEPLYLSYLPQYLL